MKVVDLQIQSAKKDITPMSSDIKISIADNYFSRLRGLLGRKQLTDKEGLLLKGCSSIHTVGMHYLLDIVFIDRDGKVVKCQEGIKPFRAASSKRAYYTLELKHGVIGNLGIKVDDKFHWQGLEG